MDRKPVKTVDEYIALQRKDVRPLLEELRRTIAKAAPKAEETISYRIPAYKQGKILVWFAAFTKHIGLYPGAAAVKAFEKDLAGYKTTKGAIQFSLDETIPHALVTKIVKYLVSSRA